MPYLPVCNIRLTYGSVCHVVFTSVLHFDIVILSKIFQQIAPLEVLVGMDNRLELIGCHDTLVLCLSNLGLVQMFKNAVGGMDR